MEDDFNNAKESIPQLYEGEERATADIVEFSAFREERYDPLVDEEVLELLRNWYRSGEALVLSADVECYRRHREAVESLSDKDAEELGLKFPCHMIRSPATDLSERVDECRANLGLWEMRTTNIIVGAWLFKRCVDQKLLEKLMPDSNFATMIPRLIEDQLVTVQNSGRIVPSRLLLYREMEQVVWLIDTLAPLVSKYRASQAVFSDNSDKMGRWPPVDEGVPSCD